MVELGNSVSRYEIQSYQISTVIAYLEWVREVHHGLNRPLKKEEIRDVRRVVGILFNPRSDRSFSTPSPPSRARSKARSEVRRQKNGKKAAEEAIAAITPAEAALIASAR